MKEEEEEDFLFADGFDDAILGIGRRATQPEVVAYDYEKCVLILMDRDEMTEEEAREYMEFNVVGGFVGDRTPIFIEPFDTLFVDEEQKTH
jgi:hypothetical protein